MAKPTRVAPVTGPQQSPRNGAEPASPAEPGGGLEVGEALRRIFVVHGALVLACALLGGVLGFGLHAADRPVYAATARVVLDTSDPTGQSDSEAYASGARAIVTSPSHVAAALQSIHVQRDAAAVAANNVSLGPMATSSVEQVTATDRDPAVAAALANALAANLVQTRLQLRTAGGPPAQAQVQAVQSNIARVDAQLASLDSQLQNAQPADVQRISTLISSLVAERASLVQEQNSLASQRSPMVIDPATPPQHPVSRGTRPDVGLGLLLGVATGLLLACLLEAVRPTLASPEAVARAAGAPLLGELNPGPEGRDWAPDREARFRLRRVAEVAGVASIQLGVAGPRIDVRGDVGAGLRGSSADAREVAPAAGRRAPTGTVLIAPSVVKKAEVDRALESLAFSDGPLLGVLTYRRRRRWSPRETWRKA